MPRSACVLRRAFHAQNGRVRHSVFRLKQHDRVRDVGDDAHHAEAEITKWKDIEQGLRFYVDVFSCKY